MNKSVKILLVFTVIISLILSFSCVQATETTPEAEQPVTQEVVDDSSQGTISDLSPSTITSISSLNNYSQANLELNNILSIILISIGVLLILFAIAILIRLKK